MSRESVELKQGPVVFMDLDGTVWRGNIPNILGKIERQLLLGDYTTKGVDSLFQELNKSKDLPESVREPLRELVDAEAKKINLNFH